jgi:hypothetical protein
MTRHDDAGDTSTIGASQHRAEIARISDPVADQEEGVFLLQERFEGNGFKSSREGEDALMALGARFAIQTSHGDDLDRYTLSLCLELNGVQDLRWVLCLGDVDSLDRATARFQ